MKYIEIAPIESLSSFTSSIDDQKTIAYFQELVQFASWAESKSKLLVAHGGFAVDLALGFLSREHDDMDIEVLRDDLPNFKKIISTLGYKIGIHEGFDPDWSFTATKYNSQHGNSLDIDFGGIEICNEDISDGYGEDKYIWPIPASQLFWKRRIGKQEIIFFSPYLEYSFKKLQRRKDVQRQKETNDFLLLEETYPELKTMKY